MGRTGPMYQCLHQAVTCKSPHLNDVCGNITSHFASLREDFEGRDSSVTIFSGGKHNNYGSVIMQQQH